MRTLGLIPARGGSKGIPGKNRRMLGDKPLLAWTAEAAHAATGLDRVVLSTDDRDIARIGREIGLDVPFMRPPELARDETPMLPVVAHALDALAAGGDDFDAVCLLQPTSPMRTPQTIDRAVTRLARGDVDTVMSVLEVPHEHNPHWVFFAEGDLERGGRLVLATGASEPIPRRQLLPPAYHRDGSIYVVRSEIVRSQGSLFGPRMAGIVGDPDRHVNLDGPEDWARAEHLIAGGPA